MGDAVNNMPKTVTLHISNPTTNQKFINKQNREEKNRNYVKMKVLFGSQNNTSEHNTKF